MDKPDPGAFLFVGLMACVLGLAVLASNYPAPNNISDDTMGNATAASAHESAHEQAWVARLAGEMGPVLAGCVWLDVSVRVEPGQLAPMLQRANGDHHLYPRLHDLVARAKARCQRSIQVVEAED